MWNNLESVITWLNKKFLSRFFTSMADEDELNSRLYDIENSTNDLFVETTRKVRNFLEKDVDYLKYQSMAEKQNFVKTLRDYENKLDLISKEQLKRIGEIRAQVQTKEISEKEVEDFISCFNRQVRGISILTEEMFTFNLRNTEIDEFTRELKEILRHCSDKIISSNLAFANSFKEMNEKLSNTITYQKWILSNIKMIQTPKLFVSPTRFDIKKFLRSIDYDKLKSSIDMTKLKSSFDKISVDTVTEKVRSFNVKETFNSYTPRGRANAAKVTYAGVFIGYLIWRSRRSKS